MSNRIQIKGWYWTPHLKRVQVITESDNLDWWECSDGNEYASNQLNAIHPVSGGSADPHKCFKKADVVAAIEFAEDYVSESQNSVLPGYVIYYPDDWWFPEKKVSFQLAQNETRPRTLRLGLVMVGALHKLFDGQIPASVLVRLNTKLLSEGMSTKTQLIKLMFAELRKGTK